MTGPKAGHMFAIRGLGSGSEVWREGSAHCWSHLSYCGSERAWAISGKLFCHRWAAVTVRAVLQKLDRLLVRVGCCEGKRA